MKKSMVAIMIGALLVAGVGTGVVSAHIEDAQPGTSWYGPMHRWMSGYMGGYGPGYCSGPGYYAPYADNVNNVQITVETIEDALEIAEDEIDADVSEDNIYQMGRWWIVYYTDDNGSIKQARIDAYTGEVIEDFNDMRYQYATTSSWRGMGHGMMYGY